MKRALTVLSGPCRSLAGCLAIAFLLLLAGCVQIPAGVQMDDDEAKACEQSGCRVWTEAEFRELMNRVWLIGYEAGRKSL